MRVTLVYSDSLAAYDLGPDHPFRPERFTRAVEMMHKRDLIGPNGMRVVMPTPATDEDLLRVHDADYIKVVKDLSASPRTLWPRHGIGPGDTPAFAGMHDASALVAGAAITAMREVLDGRAERALNIAGGLHHAHRDRAAGFCVYNDPAVGIAWALDRDPGLRVAYVDIDAHHGDGVQEAFWNEPRVLTVSMHESGRYLFPGTGFETETGGPDAPGSALNVPMPPYAGDSEYARAFAERVKPAVRAFAPDLLVTQNGADAHRADPLTTLGLTLRGYSALVESLVELSTEVTQGRMVAHGGGGYAWEDTVPRAWTALAYSLLGRPVPADLIAEE
ncbi:MAG: acetoin utilization protein AcuC [Coriobacteriales bacterium]